MSVSITSNSGYAQYAAETASLLRERMAAVSDRLSSGDNVSSDASEPEDRSSEAARLSRLQSAVDAAESSIPAQQNPVLSRNWTSDNGSRTGPGQIFEWYA